MSFHVDENGMDEALRSAAQRFVDSINPTLRLFSQQNCRQPVEMIKPELARTWQRLTNSEPPEDQLTAAAQVISDGSVFQAIPAP